MSRRKRNQEDILTCPGRVAKAARLKGSSESVPVPDGVFTQLMKKAGYILGFGGNSSELEVDQAVFQEKLGKLLRTHDNYPDTISDFVKDLGKYIEDTERLHLSVMPTATSATCKSARDVCQDSLLHLLLGIELLQEDVATLLIDKASEIADDSERLYDEKNRSVPRLIISQFRWLNKVVNSEKLSSQLMDLILVTQAEVQQDIICLVPDIITDSDHPKVAHALSEFLLSNKNLNITILETLSNLNISPEDLCEIRKQVLKTLSAVPIEDLPVVVKFVLQNLGSQEAPETINMLRQRLDLTSSFYPVSTSTPYRKSEGAQLEREVSVRIIDAIKSALRFQKPLSDYWLKVIESITEPNEHRCLDFLVLLVMYYLRLHKRNVETLFRSKIKGGGFNEGILSITFRCLSEVLKDYLPTLLVLSEILLRSYEPVITECGSLLYQKSFITFDTHNKQEIINNLMVNVGNRPVHEVNAALNTLHTLIDQHHEKVLPYAFFIKNILDHLDNLSLGQIRIVYSMLSILAYRGGREGTMLKDDLIIAIRKQLANRCLRYQRMGIIGAIMASKSSSSIRSDDTESSSSLMHSEDSYDDPVVHAKSLLELAFSCTSNSPEGLALFCDELYHIVRRRQLSKGVEEWLNAKTLAVFQKSYVCDIDEEIVKRVDPEKEFKYGLDEAEKESIAVNLHELLINWEETCGSGSTEPSNETRKMSPITLSSYFRLLRACQEIECGSELGGIDSLLGCYICLPLFHEDRISAKDKHQKLNVLFFLINWFREVINAFSPVESWDIRQKVCQRLKLLVELEDLASIQMQDAPDYKPPKAIFDCDETDAHQTKAAPASQKSSGKKNSGRGQTSKRGPSSKDKDLSTQGTQASDGATQRSTQTQLDTNSQKSSVSDKGTKKSSLCTASLPLYLRELDMEVFVLLQLKMFVNTTDSAGSSEDVQVVLNPAAMKFLLEDLTRKLQHILITPFLAIGKKKMKSVGFSNLEMNSANEVAVFTVKLLPALCQILEDCSGYFQGIISHSSCQMVLRMPVSKESEHVFSCMQYVLQAMSILFSWKGLEASICQKYLKEALYTLATRVEKLPENTGSQELVKHAIQYLCKFKDSVMMFENSTALVKVTESVTKCSTLKIQRALVDLAEEFLQREWYEVTSGKMKTSQLLEQIQILVEVYIRYSDDILDTLEYLATEGIVHLIDKDSDPTSAKFKTINKNTFSRFYRIMLYYLTQSMKIYYSSEADNKVNEFTQWTKAILVFNELVSLIKVFDEKSYLKSCLKYPRLFMEIFLRHGMPCIDKIFHSRRDDCVNLLKNLQMGTRLLQHICCHSKVVKDISLTNLVPPMKKTLESLVYRVKAMLALNKFGEAFWLGNLKNRDLKGEELLSQEAAPSEDNDLEDSDLGEAEDKQDDEQNAMSSETESSDGSEEF